VLGEALVIELSEIEKELEIHVHDARGVVRALNVAAHPVKAVGDSA
jgi:hypothetical protein